MRPRKIIEALVLQGYTELWIARQAHLAQSTIHRLKMGETRYSRLDTAEKLQKVYKQYGKPEESNVA